MEEPVEKEQPKKCGLHVRLAAHNDTDSSRCVNYGLQDLALGPWAPPWFGSQTSRSIAAYESYGVSFRRWREK